MVDLLRAFDFGRIVREVLVYDEVEAERAPFVHALVRFDCEVEVENVIGVWEFELHGAAQRKL